MEMTLYDVSDRLIKKANEKYYPKGDYVKQFDLSSKPSGVYLLRVETGKASQSFKIIKP